MILNFLEKEQWLDEETDVLFFEQTFYNGNLNSFLMLRISFEKTHGGILAGQLDIKQMVYKNPKSSTSLFVCYIVFLVNFLVEFIQLIKKALAGPRDIYILTLLTFIIFDTLSVAFMIKDRGNDWIALFSSSNPTYTQLMYFNQTYMVCRVFAEFLESRKNFEKSSHGRKLSEKSHEKVNALQAKKFWILKIRLISPSGNYLTPLELIFSKKAFG